MPQVRHVCAHNACISCMQVAVFVFIYVAGFKVMLSSTFPHFILNTCAWKVSTHAL